MLKPFLRSISLVNEFLTYLKPLNSKLNLILGEKIPELAANAGEESVANLDWVRNANGAIPTATLRLNMQRTMQNHAAVFREQTSLTEGVKKMGEIYKTIKDVQVTIFEHQVNVN